MITFVKRLILTAVAVPSFYALCIVLDEYHHLALNIAIAVVMAGGVVEAARLGRHSGEPVSTVVLPIAASTLVPVTYLELAGIVPAPVLALWFTALVGSVLVATVVKAQRHGAEASFRQAATWMLQLVYPGFLATYMVRMAWLPHAPLQYLLFFCLIFTNDTSAYLAGRIAGPGTALGLAASPAKTAVGFVTGFLMSIGFAVIFRLAAPHAFPGMGWMIGIGAMVGVTTILGDLVESAMKRSAGVKDSGRLMFGRGGVLDSVDSMLLSAPVFVVLMRLAGRA